MLGRKLVHRDSYMIANDSSIAQLVTNMVRWCPACSKLSSLVVVVLTIISCQALHAQTKVSVSSLRELREVIQGDNQTIVMKPGRYVMTELPEKSRNLPVWGSNNTIDLSDVYVAVPVGSTDGEYISILGDDNVFVGGTFEDLYKSGLDQIVNFSAYNKDRHELARGCLLYTSPSPRDRTRSRMPSSA